MKISVIGSGGREYAIAKKIFRTHPDLELHIIPGNAAMEEFAQIHPEISATDITGVRNFCLKHQIDFCVVTPDDPLVLGMVDELEDAGISCFGPRKAAAMLEGSKSFAKEFMARHNIPTAKYASFDDFTAAAAYARQVEYPAVIKADGLALGKGVKIVENITQAEQTLRELIVDRKFGASSQQVIIEEFLSGPELSVLSFCDGNVIKPMVCAMDHKRVFNDDCGPNTGGMGAIAPNPVFTAAVADEFREKIMLPTLAGLKADGINFRGCLYFGLMLTENGLKVIEYNARFGDPETQVILPLLKGDLLEIFEAVAKGKLAEVPVEFIEGYSACVVLAAKGYPENPVRGKEISFNKQVAEKIVFAGVKRNSEGKLITNGGRVLNILGFGKTLKEAISQAYQNVAEVKFAESHFRTDIGAKALKIAAGVEK